MGAGRNSSNWGTRNRACVSISISSCAGWMLSFYHILVPGTLGGYEQHREGAQRLEIDVSGIRKLPRPAGLGVAHPTRDLQAGIAWPLRRRATHDAETVPASLRLDLHLLFVPRVPPVAHFQHVGIVGVRSLGCIIAGARISRWLWIVRTPARCPRPRRARSSPSRKWVDSITTTSG